MREEEERILKMVEAGAISAEEAGELLSAIEEGEEAVSAEAADLPGTAQGAKSRFDRAWEVPFFGGLIVAGFGMLGLLRARGRDGSLVRAGAGLTLILGLLGVFVGLWSRDAVWLHLRVQERDGDNVKLSFPLPLGLANWVIDMARGYVDEETGVHLDSAKDFIGALRRGESGEPFTVEVDEGDGDRVFIQIG